MGKTYTEEFKEMVVRDRVQNGLSVKEASKNTEWPTDLSVSGRTNMDF